MAHHFATREATRTFIFWFIIIQFRFTCGEINVVYKCFVQGYNFYAPDDFRENRS